MSQVALNTTFAVPLQNVSGAITALQALLRELQSANASLYQRMLLSRVAKSALLMLICVKRMLSGSVPVEDDEPMESIQDPGVGDIVAAAEPGERRKVQRATRRLRYRMQDALIGLVQREGHLLDRHKWLYRVQEQFPAYPRAVLGCRDYLLNDGAIAEKGDGTLEHVREPKPRPFRTRKPRTT